MAIMWNPPAERLSFEETPAELTWKQWLLEVLIAKANDQAPTDPPVAQSTDQLPHAA